MLKVQKRKKKRDNIMKKNNRMKKDKHIIIFRANGPLKNTYLTDKLKKLNFKIINYPILIVKKIYTKEIKVNNNDVVITTSFNSIYYLSQLTQNRISDFPRLQAIQTSVSREGLKLNILTRLSPVFPFKKTFNKASQLSLT